jgi:hypothetical protein
LGGRVEPAGGPDEDEEEEHEHKGEGVEDVEPDFFGLERGGCGEGAGGRKREREREMSKMVGQRLKRKGCRRYWE